MEILVLSYGLFYYLNWRNNLESEKKSLKQIIEHRIDKLNKMREYGHNPYAYEFKKLDNKQYNLGLLVDRTEGISVYPEGDEKDGYELNSINIIQIMVIYF